MMPAFGQLLHEEDYYYAGNRYCLKVYRVDGGLTGRWRCETCLMDIDDHDCPTYVSIEACLSGMKQEIRKHHRKKHGAQRKGGTA